MATKQGGTSVYNVEDRCTRCGDAAGNERVHVFQSGVTMEKYAGYAIDSIDEIGDAQAVPADKLYEYRRQERARQEQEAAAAHATAHMVQAFAARVKQVLAAIPLPSFGRVIGKSTMPPQGADAPTIPVVPDGPLIRPSLITRGTLELMLRKHADTLQAAAAILGQNVGMLQTRIAELKQQETTAKETVATQPEQQPETPAPQEEQK